MVMARISSGARPEGRMVLVLIVSAIALEESAGLGQAQDEGKLRKLAIAVSKPS
jgi:hypothetical protein